LWKRIGDSEINMKRAFTLMELLTVIAIIGILAALIFPALSKAKNRASRVTDINNLKQIMLAVHSYAGESNDILPPPNWDQGGPTGTNSGWLYTPRFNAVGSERFKVETGLLWPTLQTPKVYICPLDNVLDVRHSQSQGYPAQRQQQLSSYAMNGSVIGYMDAVYPPARLSSMRPEDCAFWETDETDPFYFNDGANFPMEGVSGRHSQGAIQAAFDGSVSYVRLTTWYGLVADTNRNRLWCNPHSADGH
jgi:prepilin-type N-terminal cleavage/methylation domain-containing protein